MDISSSISFDKFAAIVASVDSKAVDRALSILWYYDQQQHDATKTSGELARCMDDYHLGKPHSTRLSESLVKSRKVVQKSGGFQLKPGSRQLIYESLKNHLAGIQPEIDHNAGYLAQDVWVNTRPYIENIARQLNGCFEHAYYDAASVMLRRLIETLIIESYEYLGRRIEILDSSGNPFMLKQLIVRAKGENDHIGLNLGRDANQNLDEIKKLGDRAAHNRRFNAKFADLEQLRSGVRVTIQELIQVAGLQ
ncbi:MAG: DUF4145 domain-containing protein [Planctomycetota bacterium]